jgi:uncharacterized protein involved in tolerance to divalent cations
MKTTVKFAVVLLTAPDLKTARQLAQAALKSRLIACANLIPKSSPTIGGRGKSKPAAKSCCS